MPNPQNLKPFQKGPDKRRNTKGRPKSFDKLRELAKQIALEEVTNKSGETVTIVEAILRGWAADKRMQEKFIEYAYGKAPSSVDVTSGGEKIKGYAIISPEDWDNDKS